MSIQLERGTYEGQSCEILDEESHYDAEMLEIRLLETGATGWVYAEEVER